MITIRCVCGGWLKAWDDLMSKRDAVVEHNASLLHRVWRWHREHEA